MSHRLARLASLLAVALLCLPLHAATARARPQGLYTYNLTGSVTVAGKVYNDRDKGTLTVSGTRITGQSNDRETTFTLKFANRIGNASPQTTQAAGSVAIVDDVGSSQGKITANVRIQRTRAGIWKTTFNYSGRFTRGEMKGATVSGKVVAKSA